MKLKNNFISKTLLAAFCISSSLAGLKNGLAASQPDDQKAQTKDQLSKPVKGVSQIARVINKDIITEADINARLKLFFLSSGKQYDEAQARLMRPQVIQKYRTELLQIQAAEKAKLSVPVAHINKTLENQAKENNMSLEQMKKFFQDNGVPLETLSKRLKAQILWAQYIRKKYGFLVHVSESEIDQMLKKIRDDQNKEQFHIWEIFLRIESPEKKARVYQEAQQLVRQLREGASFREVARQFSQAPSAMAGGDVGKVTYGRIPPELECQVKNMKVGDVSNPILTSTGYYIIRLNDRNVGGKASSRDSLVTFQQVIIPLGMEDGLSKVQEAEIKVEVLMRANSCSELKTKAENLELQVGQSPEVPLNQLPEALQEMLLKAPVGKCATPIRTPQGLIVTMPCTKKVIPVQLPNRQEVKEMLEQEKFSQYSNKELLKLDAVAYEEVKSN